MGKNPNRPLKPRRKGRGRGALSGANLIAFAPHRNADVQRQLGSVSHNMPPPPPPHFNTADSRATMAPAPRPAPPAPESAPVTGPHPSYIQVAKPYVFQQQLQGQLVAMGANPTREDTFRLQGVQWISDVRIHLQLPVRTFCTACVYYHKFRLVHRDNEYQFQDAAAAALLTACKIEDTLKKSKEILCAAHNAKVGISEQLSPDDNAFEGPSKIVIGLERLMLEASGFDFRVRFPHKHLVKLAKASKVDDDVSKVAFKMMIDLYRTFAPLKHSCAAMSFACIELATILLNKQQDFIRGEHAPSPQKWHTSRAQIMEAILDLVEHYTHFPKASIVGPSYPIDTFINIRINMNQELEAESLTRYTEQHDAPKTNGIRSNIKTPKTPITPASPSDLRTNGNKDVASPATLSPRSSGSGRKGIGARGQEGTVRFMLDAEKAKQEKEEVAQYYRVEWEEYEVEVEEPIRQEKNDHGHNHNQNHRGGGQHMRNGRDGGFHHKRVRR
ncbi:CTD kinase subunit beta [Lachnellula hyalina]|uniref:RNA polymerase II holoenzyme cyclin-like subunit n=1 Tax=Lachnellula hyalina TaxID=1316788 RepID=A0A8H8TXU1_9HELO|nr:CTD kinase subunit beta [Lachnellula hyalina]TVY23291.1 CTD kinase subunit beta [Lachnellula hyalina]